MVEHAAVNRVVVGSSPTSGANLQGNSPPSEKGLRSESLETAGFAFELFFLFEFLSQEQ